MSRQAWTIFSVGGIVCVIENYAQAPMVWAISPSWVLGSPFLLVFVSDSQVGLSNSYFVGVKIMVLTLTIYIFAWSLVFWFGCKPKNSLSSRSCKKRRRPIPKRSMNSDRATPAPLINSVIAVVRSSPALSYCRGRTRSFEPVDRLGTIGLKGYTSEPYLTERSNFITGSRLVSVTGKEK